MSRHGKSRKQTPWDGVEEKTPTQEFLQILLGHKVGGINEQDESAADAFARNQLIDMN